MKRILIWVFLVTLLISGQAEAKGGFGLTCYQLSLEGSVLTALCAKNNGGKRSSINLYGLIRNDNGSLDWISSNNSALPSGFEVCKDLKLQGKNNAFILLNGNCPDNQGHFKYTSINLNEKITNSDGDLKYDP